MMNENAIVRINDETPVYCSAVAETKKQKALLYNAVQNPDGKISEYINKKLTIKDVHLEKTTYTDDEGVVTDAVKVTLITPDGKGIVCTSKGILRSLYSLFQIFGTPDTWEDDDPMIAYVRQVETAKGRTFKLEIAE